MVVREFSNVTLRCAANGSPRPNITWRREYGSLLQLPDGREALTAEGENYTIARVTREHMGAYLCIASNGVPPSISKRIGLTVEFPPVIDVSKQLVGARLGRPLVLQCTSQAFPKSHNYWVRADNMLVQGPGYETEMVESSYSISMRLTIESVTHYDFGEYKCVSKNYLGETEQSIKVEHVKSQDTGWGPAATKLPKHSKGKYLGRPVSENSIEIPDAEESTSASSPAARAIANVFLVLATLPGALNYVCRTTM
ncbi:neurotrimin-like [Frankliniella occidentalis]|uniref:Neurotrimin-like n=1 Tax=Frankliniella occidentalis TaxID=133901 RepID=A0A9C6XQR2_FRAOC|nr:neurotrimin-like [Frankliniella occidentalis]